VQLTSENGLELRFNAELKYEVRGWPGRVIGVICLLPIPLSLATGVVGSTLMAVQGKDLTDNSSFWVRTAIEGGVVLACAVAIGVIRLAYRTPVEAPWTVRSLGLTVCGTEQNFRANFEREGRATRGWTTVPSWRARSSDVLGARHCHVEKWRYRYVA